MIAATSARNLYYAYQAPGSLVFVESNTAQILQNIYKRMR